MARAIDVDRVKREIRKNKEKIVISCKQKYVPLSLIYEILNKAPTLTPPNEWVSVEERLPESDLPKNSTKLQIKVLVAIRAKNGYTVRTQNRIRQEKSWMSGGGFTDWYWRYSAGEVTHWMPIPQSPKEAKK